jgi:drug/metabolite transporter (DMT)-like permease
MNAWKISLLHPGIVAALAAALLFGAGAPLAKLLLRDLNPLAVAGLLYLGSGLGLTLYRALRHAPAVQLPRGEWKWLVGAIFCGGLIGPALLMWGLASLSAVSTSLLLNAEGVFTALLAWGLFHEHVGKRLALGMALIAAGALLLGWPGSLDLGSGSAALAVLGACLAWGLDNNLTRRVSLHDASWIAALKGLCAGSLNLLLALAFSGSGIWPSAASLALWPLVLLLGFFSYGVSLSLFVVALRSLGTARSGAYFSVAPFFGALLALALGEPATPALWLAGALMATGVWLHLSESHAHEHRHETLEHQHLHRHDAHHQHPHPTPGEVRGPHSHVHVHESLRHHHAHYPDAHHEHEH